MRVLLSASNLRFVWRDCRRANRSPVNFGDLAAQNVELAFATRFPASSITFHSMWPIVLPRATTCASASTPVGQN
jgi:hypothetical protein